MTRPETQDDLKPFKFFFGKLTMIQFMLVIAAVGVILTVVANYFQW